MIHNIFFLIPFFLIGTSFAIAQIEQVEKLTVQDVSNEKLQNKILDISQIEDGSQIKNTKYKISIDAPPEKICQVRLLDKVLNPIPISQKFNCNGLHDVQLTKEGIDALQYNLVNDTFKINIVSEDNQQIDFAVSNIDVDYTTPKYFALIENGKVANVIVAEQDFISGIQGDWIETKMDNSIRGHYAAIGDQYDIINDVFVSPIIEKPVTSGVNATK